ncbi:MAG: DinB family protein [Dehalococcoidia bacterium]
MDSSAEPPGLLDALRATPIRFRAASANRSPGELQKGETAGAWSANEILWHIRAAADVYGEHIARILDEDTPSWRHVSPRARMKKVQYNQIPFAESLAAFERQRSALVTRLDALPIAAWKRFAIVRVEKRERKLTLQERIWGMVTHEAVHCEQVEALLPRQ